MSISSADEVRASVALQHHATRDSMVALIVVQYRPQAMVAASQAKTLGACLMEEFKASGWEDPVLLFRGGHLASSAQVDVTGALDPRTEVTITGASSADVLYAGPIPRDESVVCPGPRGPAASASWSASTSRWMTRRSWTGSAVWPRAANCWPPSVS